MHEKGEEEHRMEHIFLTKNAAELEIEIN